MVVAACGGTAAKPSTPVVLPAPTAATVDASAPTGPTADAPSSCWSPLAAGAITDPKLAPKQIDDAALARADAASDPLERDFVRARLQFEANHWVEAGRGFRAIAMDHHDADIGIFAAQLELESLNALARFAGREDCFVDLAKDLARFQELYCTARRHLNEDSCRLFDTIHYDLERMEAERTIAAAAKTSDARGYLDGGAKSLALVQKYCLPKTYENCDELAFNGAVAYLAGGDKASAEKLRALLVDPKNKMSTSPLVKKLACRMDGPTSPACR